MNLLSMGAIAVVAIVVGSVALPVLADGWNGDDNDARRLTEATGATVRKADDLGDSFGRVVPSRVEAPDADHIGTPAQPGGEQLAEPHHHDGYSLSTEHEVAAALQALAALDASHTDFTSNEHVAAIQDLQHAWDPRYRRAKEEHERLSYRIDHADRAAKRYFDTQRNLTRQINNADDRLRAEQGDAQEWDLYRQWREQAGRTMAQADRIMVDLEDMDIRIAKQLLSANFAAVYRDFQQMPAAISALHRDLERFHAKSREINAAFGGY